MTDKKEEYDKVLKLALIGILGVLITTISDFFLLGRPVSGAVFFQISTESMTGIAHWRITLGTFLGVVSLPFEVIGLAPLYYRLKASGRIMTWSILILYAHALLMGVAFHMSYAFMANAWKLYYGQALDPIIKVGLIDRFEGYWRLLLVIVGIELMIGTLLYIIVILKGRTSYPRWMAAVNPISCILLVVPVLYVLPPPIGGFIAPAVLNIATILFIFITLLVYRKVERSKN